MKEVEDKIIVRKGRVDDNSEETDACNPSKLLHNTIFTNSKKMRGNQLPVLIFRCKDCGEEFTTSVALTSHSLFHGADRHFPCKYCTKRFKDKHAVARHERTHKENGVVERNEICEDCDATFSDIRSLRKHIRIHTGVRPYVCEECQKAFSNSSSYSLHQRMHTNTRPFPCDYCGKRFICKSHLTTHVRTHSGVKPYHCEPCNRSFSDCSSFRRHKKTHLLNLQSRGKWKDMLSQKRHNILQSSDIEPIKLGRPSTSREDSHQYETDSSPKS